MIKKLEMDQFIIRKSGIDMIDNQHEIFREKINEIIDAVNKLTPVEVKYEKKKHKSV
jgi:hypothetical protein